MWASDEPQFLVSHEILYDRFLAVLKPHDPSILCFHTSRDRATDTVHLALPFRGNFFDDHVHKEAIVIAVQNESGKLVIESVIKTKASSILQFLHGLRGELHVTREEGTWAAWRYDLLQPQVQHIVECNPRRNALLSVTLL